MQVQRIVAEEFVKLPKPGFMFCRAPGVVVLCLALSVAWVPSCAFAEIDQAQPINHHMMDMDHMQMDHGKLDSDLTGMDHSHHVAGKAGAYKSSVVPYTVPNVKLMDMNRSELLLTDVLGSRTPVMLNFVFTTCPTICPLMSAIFQQVQDQLGTKRTNVRMVSISIDPENDTPEKLRAYADKFSMGPQWTMLTGTLADSIAVQKAFGIYAGEKMNHTPVTFLKAQGVESTWVRIDGLAKAVDILKELDQLSNSNSLK